MLDGKTSRWSVISSLPCPTDGSHSYFWFFIGKAPHLNSLRERSEFVVSPQGLDCLQFKIIHTPECHLLGRPGRDFSVGTAAAVPLGCFDNASGSWGPNSSFTWSRTGSGRQPSWHQSFLYVLRIILMMLRTGQMLSLQVFHALVHRTALTFGRVFDLLPACAPL